ncbi:MAG TPA: hypothetical protein PLB05_10975 [Candidatus Omnitrophota bacterium]|nr:hypothetical protein [Candidatus Omnitrophota bacterium]
MKKTPSVLMIFVFCFMAATCASAETPLGDTLRELVLEGMRATEREDVNGVLQTIHHQSPVYDKISQQLLRIFEDYDLKYELLSYVFLGSDNEYAVARITQTTEKVDQKPDAPSFQGNRADIIQVFRRDKESWKFWNQVVLEFELSGE